MVAGTLISDADAAHHDPLAGRRAAVGAEGRAGDQVGAGDGCRGRCLEKVSPIGTLFHGSAFPFLKHGRMSPACAMHVSGPIQPGLPKVGRTSDGGQRRVKRRRDGIRIRSKIDGDGQMSTFARAEGLGERGSRNAGAGGSSDYTTARHRKSSTTPTASSPRLTTALTWKKARFTRLKSSGRTSQCS